MESLRYLEGYDDSHLIDISFRNIVYQVAITKQDDNQSGTKTILSGVSGIFKAGELNVIMGASGAGKTTLLNILSGRISDFKGEILANNTPYSFQTFGDFANYVMQGDLLMQTLTVRQTLQFAARLKLSNEQIAQQRISQLTKKLKLEKCIDVLVGGPIIKGISGGERKRTSIAFQLMGDPQVLALDQPTSGMDSLTSYVIVNELKELTRAGKTVYLTIHQPNSEIFGLFDRLLLMVEGRIIFQGPAGDAESYFASHFGLQCPQFQNPADYFMSIMHHETNDNYKRYPEYFSIYSTKIESKMEQRLEQRNKNQIKSRVVGSNSLNTLKQLLRRDYINITRHPIVMKSRIVQVIFMSIYTGGLYFNAGRKEYDNPIYWQAIVGYLFFISMDLFMQGMMPVAITFPMQRLIFLKEQNSKMYGVVPYFLSRNIIEIPYIIIIPMIFQLINYWMIGLGQTAEQFFTMYLIVFLLSFTATSAGMLAGSIVTDQKNISNIILLIALPLITFSGFYKNNGNLADWIGWIRYLSPFNYCFTALVWNQSMYKPSFVTRMNYDTTLWESVGILLALGLGFRLLSCFFLWLKKGKLQ